MMRQRGMEGREEPVVINAVKYLKDKSTLKGTNLFFYYSQT